MLPGFSCSLPMGRRASPGFHTRPVKSRPSSTTGSERSLIAAMLVHAAVLGLLGWFGGSPHAPAVVAGLVASQLLEGSVAVDRPDTADTSARAIGLLILAVVAGSLSSPASGPPSGGSRRRRPRVAAVGHPHPRSAVPGRRGPPPRSRPVHRRAVPVVRAPGGPRDPGDDGRDSRDPRLVGRGRGLGRARRSPASWRVRAEDRPDDRIERGVADERRIDPIVWLPVEWRPSASPSCRSRSAPPRPTTCRWACRRGPSSCTTGSVGKGWSGKQNTN